MKKYVVSLLVICFIFTGCSTVTGPSVSKEEIKKAADELKLKALAYRIGQAKKINEIGYKLVRRIPPEDIKIHSRPFLGLFCLDRTKLTERFYNAKPEGGVFIAFTMEGTPAARAGLKPGDVVMGINDYKINNIRKLVSSIGKLKEVKSVVVKVLRAGRLEAITVDVEQLPLDVRFSIIDEHSVNAATGPKQVFVTYGLLNFTQSDDEIAAVLGHELAHLSRAHLKRKIGGKFVTTFLAIGLGIAAEVASSGSGSIVMRSVGGIGDVFGAKFSRDLEREADYFGVKYIYLTGYDPEVVLTFHERFAIEIPGTMTRDYFSTHPSSPERTVRVRKAIDELRSKSEELEDISQ